MEMRENVDWVKNKMGIVQGQGQGESVVATMNNNVPDQVVHDVIIAEDSRITQLHK